MGEHWIAFCLRDLRSTKMSLEYLASVMHSIINMMEKFKLVAYLSENKFSQVKLAMSSGLKEIVRRQKYPEIMQEQISLLSISNEPRQCFKSNRSTRLLHALEELEEKLESTHGPGIVRDRVVGPSQNEIAITVSKLPATSFKWRKVSI